MSSYKFILNMYEDDRYNYSDLNTIECVHVTKIIWDLENI